MGVSIRVLKLKPEAQLPRYAHLGAYGDLAADMYSAEALTIAPGATVPVSTGVALEFPPTHGALVEDRSGLAVRGVTTLAGVIDHYAAGGRTISSGPYAGIGHDNPNKALNLHGFKLTDVEKGDLIAFLESLTDTEFLKNPSLADPWRR